MTVGDMKAQMEQLQQRILDEIQTVKELRASLLEKEAALNQINERLGSEV